MIVIKETLTELTFVVVLMTAIKEIPMEAIPLVELTIVIKEIPMEAIQWDGGNALNKSLMSFL